MAMNIIDMATKFLRVCLKNKFYKVQTMKQTIKPVFQMSYEISFLIFLENDYEKILDLC